MFSSNFKKISFLFLFFLPFLAQADELSGANTAWILSSTALVLFMTLPGLALFYGGLVRSKNILSILMQCFAIAGIVSILWVAIGYSIAFDEGNPYFGGMGKAFFAGITQDSMQGDIPESLFAMFQMTFAIITPALIIGGFAERTKFSAVVLFSALWLILVYAPITHWVWGGADGYKKWAYSILLGVLLFISPLVLRHWLRQLLSAHVNNLAKLPLHHTI